MNKNRTENLRQRIAWKAIVCFFIAIVIVGLALYDFRSRVYQRENESQINRMQGAVSQISEVLEERLVGYLHTISGLTELFVQGELHTAENLERLDRAASENNMDFYSLGITDVNGLAWVTNGNHLDISERPFFKRALKGEKVISRKFDSMVTGTDIFMVAVPIRSKEGNIRGVLYGTMRVEDFPLFRDENMRELSKYVHVIDSGGNYIFRGQDVQRILEGENFYDSMEEFSTEMSVGEIRNKMLSGEDLLLNFSKETEEYILCTALLSASKWNMVLVTKASYIEERVSHLLGNDIYWLILKSIVAFMVVCGIIMWYLQNDKKYILKLYSHIRMQDRLIRKAIAAIDSVILFYDAEQDKLKILSDNQNRLELPPDIFDASQKLTEYLPLEKEDEEELLYVMSRLRKMEDIDSFELPLTIEGAKKRFNVRIEKVAGEGQESFRYVGIVEDITEKVSLEHEIQLQQKLAERDDLTGLYNRRSAVEIINGLLEEPEARDMTNAFVLLDMDNFKKVNDTLGHQTGDRALKDVAQTMLHHFREYDVVSRLGGG